MKKLNKNTKPKSGAYRKRKGSNNELKVKKLLLEYFPYVVKSGGSLGIFDLHATNFTTISLYVQCKTNKPVTYMSDEDNLLNDISELKTPYSFKVLVIYIKDNINNQRLTVKERTFVFDYNNGNCTYYTWINWIKKHKSIYGLSKIENKKIRIKLGDISK